MGTHTLKWMCGGRNNFQDVRPKTWTHIIRLGIKCLHPQSHLTNTEYNRVLRFTTLRIIILNANVPCGHWDGTCDWQWAGAVLAVRKSLEYSSEALVSNHVRWQGSDITSDFLLGQWREFLVKTQHREGCSTRASLILWPMFETKCVLSELLRLSVLSFWKDMERNRRNTPNLKTDTHKAGEWGQA